MILLHCIISAIAHLLLHGCLCFDATIHPLHLLLSEIGLSLLEEWGRLGVSCIFFFFLILSGILLCSLSLIGLRL